MLLKTVSCPGPCEDFHYTKVEGGSSTIGGVDDLASLKQTLAALRMLGFSAAQRKSILGLLAAILHLGNIEMSTCRVSEGLEGCRPVGNRSVSMVAELLGVDRELLTRWLCNRRFVTANESFLNPMTRSQVIGFTGLL